MEKMMAANSYGIVILLVFFLLILAEIVWSWRNDKKVYHLKESMTNLFILAGFSLSKVLLTSYQLAIMDGARKMSLATWNDSWISFVMVFVLVDFTYYWYHRLSHRWEPLWIFHSVHHSSKHINLTAAYRLNWLSGLITPFFFVPLVLVGFSPKLVAICFALNLVYQFFLHTEVVGKLGKLEGVLDTPSAHRVHHGINPQYLDKNFGGVFMFWDRLFGTYQSELEKPVYGEINGPEGNNPFVLLFHGLYRFFRVKRLMKKMLLLVALFVGLSSTAFGQFSKSDWTEATSKERADYLTSLLVRELTLDSAQTKSIQSINEKFALLINSLWKSDEKRDAKRKKGVGASGCTREGIRHYPN